MKIELISLAEGEAEIRVGDRVHVVPYAISGTRVSFVYGGETYSIETAEKGRGRARHRDHSMEAPMPGLILKILVTPGSVVKKGAPVVILEAMKMEHQIVASHDGTVAAVNCSEGQMVEPGVELVEIR